MKTPILCLLIFFLEASWSIAANYATVTMVSRKRVKTLIYDIIALGIAYFVLATLARSDWNILMIICAILGSALGNYIVASRKPKKKRKPFKKIGVTTA